MIPEIGNWIVWYLERERIWRGGKYRQTLRTNQQQTAAILDYWEHRARFEKENGEIRSLTRAERNDPADYSERSAGNIHDFPMPLRAHQLQRTIETISITMAMVSHAQKAAGRGQKDKKPKRNPTTITSEPLSATVIKRYQTNGKPTNAPTNVTRQRERGNAPRDASAGPNDGALLYPCPPGSHLESKPKRTTSYRSERTPHTWEKHSVEVLRRRDSRNGTSMPFGNDTAPPQSNRKTIRGRNAHHKVLERCLLDDHGPREN